MNSPTPFPSPSPTPSVALPLVNPSPTELAAIFQPVHSATVQKAVKVLDFVGDWSFAIGALASAIILVPIVESVMVRVSRMHRRRWVRLLGEVAGPFSKLIFVLGLKLFIDAAPLKPNVVKWLNNGAFLIFVFCMLETLRRAAIWGIDWITHHDKPRGTTADLNLGFVPILKNMATLFFFLLGLMTILKHFGYDIMSIIAALGVGSLAVGLAAKDTLSNMISGFTLIIDRNLKPGDRISIGGSVGLVQEIGLRSTKMDLRDGNVMIIPNQDLVNSRIINLSMTQNQFGASTKFRVSLEVPFEQVSAIVLDIAANIPKADKTRKPWVYLTAILDGQQLISAGFGIADPDDQSEALSQFHTTLVSRLAKAGIQLLSDPNAPRLP